VDLRVPCRASTRRPLFAHCRDPCGFWVQLAEKALAKKSGSYAALRSFHRAPLLLSLLSAPLLVPRRARAGAKLVLKQSGQRGQHGGGAFRPHGLSGAGLQPRGLPARLAQRRRARARAGRRAAGGGRELAMGGGAGARAAASGQRAPRGVRALRREGGRGGSFPPGRPGRFALGRGFACQPRLLPPRRARLPPPGGPRPPASHLPRPAALSRAERGAVWQDGSEVRAVLVRNPWGGEGGWAGPLCPGSPAWQELRRAPARCHRHRLLCGASPRSVMAPRMVGAAKLRRGRQGGGPGGAGGGGRRRGVLDAVVRLRRLLQPPPRLLRRRAPRPRRPR